MTPTEEPTIQADFEISPQKTAKKISYTPEPKESKSVLGLKEPELEIQEGVEEATGPISGGDVSHDQGQPPNKVPMGRDPKRPWHDDSTSNSSGTLPMLCGLTPKKDEKAPETKKKV